MGGFVSNAIGGQILQTKRKDASFFTSRGIQLNHYYCLSEDEMAAKIDRGAASFASAEVYAQRVLTKVSAIEADVVYDDCAKVFIENGLTGCERQT